MPENLCLDAVDSVGSFGHVDPAKLVIGANVRDEPDLEADFVDSVRQHGVLVPVTAVVDEDDGQLHVRDGQRRVLAARAAGLAVVPVYVIPIGANDPGQSEVIRVVHQIVANDQHVALSDGQRARGIQQLLDAGLTVARAAKLLSKPRAVITSAAKAGKSEAAMAALSSGQLTLEQAAAVAEFYDDAAAVDKLIAAPDGLFEHCLSQLRRARQTARVLAEAAEGYRVKGFTVLESEPGKADPCCVPLHALRDADGQRVDEEVVVDPTHWAVLLEEEERCFDETGALVDEDDLDHPTRFDRDAAAAEGLRPYDRITMAWVAVPTWYCLDPQAVGLTPSWLVAPSAQLCGKVAGGDLSGVEDPEIGDAGDEPQTSAESSIDDHAVLVESRRNVAALNRLGEAAAEVRRRWIRTNLLSGKKPPKGAAVFCAAMLAAESGLLGDYRAADAAAELLGRRPGPGVLRDHAAGLADDGRAQIMTLALVLGALENRCTKDFWRRGQAWAHTVGPKDALAWLRSAGYTLSDIELVVLGEKNPATIDLTLA